MPLLEVNKLAKHFNTVEALHDISFTLDKGKTLSIIGSSGSGKTTLLRCLNFLETADGGSMLLNGKEIFNTDNKELPEDEKRKMRTHFGLVFQQFNLFPQYTALENILLAPRLLKKDTGEDKALALLESMGLLDRRDHYPHELSGGQQQRVAIARALINEPDILCFDEPTSALDPELTGEVLRVIKELASRKMTMIIVTHEISFAREVSDEIIFMDKGEMVEYGEARELIDHPKNERTRRFLSGMNNYR